MGNEDITPVSGGGATYFKLKAFKKLLSDLKKNIKLYFDRQKFKPRRYPIIMSDSEKAFFKETVSDVVNYLEFGSGGSTFLTLLNSKAKRIISVESDCGWLDYLRKWKLVETSEGEKLQFYPVNIGKTGEWGVPLENDKKDLFPDYSQDVFKIKDNCTNNLIFIDGRFRVACALQAIINSDNDVKIMIHDYTIRPEYHCVEQFLEVMKSVDTMVLFKKKDHISIDEVLKMYDEYKYIYD